MAADSNNAGKLAIILVRSIINVHPDVRKTLQLLNLKRKNACVIVPDNANFRGMLKVVKDYVTWGEIDEETEKMLYDKRTPHQRANGERQTHPSFNLHPPRKGYGRTGVKSAFTRGGALGNRKSGINSLIQRMI